METIVDNYLAKWKLDDSDSDQAKEDLIVVINDCFKDYVDHLHREFYKVVPPTEPPKTGKKSKNTPIVLENPAEAESLVDLGRCTVTSLSNFCKTNKLKVGGKKEEITARVWRFLQGETSDEDKSMKSKSATTTKGKKSDTSPTHVCEAVTKAGKECNLSCSDQCPTTGKWLCFRHLPKTKTTTTTGESAGSGNESGGEFGGCSSTTATVEINTHSITKPKKSKAKKVIPTQLEEESD